MNQGIVVLQSVEECRAFRAEARGVVGLVPTMGALHEGHVSLVRAARRRAGPGGGGGVVIASVFVNPTQFGAGEDFGKYPRTLESDLNLLAGAGADAVFVPTNEVMYPGGEAGEKEGGVTVDPGVLGMVLEGAIRPGHFRGVCTVVCKLIGIVGPTELVMGQKDYQQNAVLRRMIADLNLPVEHVMEPTVREADGLAMSSRNRYLSADERGRAVGIFEALSWAKGEYEAGRRGAERLAAGMRERIAGRGMEVQYAVVGDAVTLQEKKGEVGGKCVLLAAAKVGTTRLIDNMILADA